MWCAARDCSPEQNKKDGGRGSCPGLNVPFPRFVSGPSASGSKPPLCVSASLSLPPRADEWAPFLQATQPGSRNPSSPGNLEALLPPRAAHGEVLPVLTSPSLTILVLQFTWSLSSSSDGQTLEPTPWQSRILHENPAEMGAAGLWGLARRLTGSYNNRLPCLLLSLSSWVAAAGQEAVRLAGPILCQPRCFHPGLWVSFISGFRGKNAELSRLSWGYEAMAEGCAPYNKCR
ncbi:hypothetical protein GGR56DRAFT_624558 [Xylariaceae sp. FL0804]|nr:hypothetical protein GGR56DRAFT_624558 [Xylariaceae sp. FL0804]